MKRLLLLCLAAGILLAQSASISGDRIRAHVKFLSSDLLEGRGVGVRGGETAAEYIGTEFALDGLKPAGDKGTFFQAVPLVGVTTGAGVSLTASKDGLETSFEWLEDFVGSAENQQEDNAFDGEAIFVGHGISAPEFHWDDYKDLDVRGKILVLFTNEPPSDDPKFFNGRALTYYGRWVYKYEEATRRGARAVFILHTTPTAGYGFDVVRNSWGKEDPQLKLAPGAHGLDFAGWLTQGASEKLAVMAGTTLDAMLASANSPGFHAVPLGVKLRGHIPSKIRAIESRNVAALVPGSDPKLKDEAVVFSAHWDHLGVGTPVNGDAIYNGAVDNATGCGVILEIARAWANLPRKPRRSALFLSVTAEEAGLLGSEYYGLHPLIPNGKVALDLNYDALYPFGRTRDVAVTGAERTTVWPVVEAIAKEHAFGHRSRIAPRARALLPFRSFLLRPLRRASVLDRHGRRFRRQAERLRRNRFRRLQHQALPPTVGRISRRLGLLRHGADGAVRHGDRSRSRQSTGDADVERGRRISPGAPEERRQLISGP